MNSKKLITFSLWGHDPKYLVGAIRNAELAQEIYPDWICRFYVGSSVPLPIKLELKKLENVEIVTMNQWGDWRGMFWRFLPASEPGVEAMISRDTDSRLNLREKAAVDEWLASDKGFHIMRDHPFHKFPVLGGMWGVKAGILPEMTHMINHFAQEDKYGTDYEFFAQVIIPHIRDNALVHDEFFSGNPFPTPREDYQFVGQVFDENEETVEEHINALKAYLK
tara:strand:+ start:72 stop:737 length:666 start_codon:yes stop_codon:yes gene_type:complete